MIHPDLITAATALSEIADHADARLLAELVPLFGRGIVMAQRDMLLFLLETESEWPWNQPDGVSCCHR